MARVLLVLLMVLGLAVAVVFLEDGWASCALKVDGLRLGDGQALNGHGLEELYFGGGDLWRNEECVGDGRQASRGKKRS